MVVTRKDKLNPGFDNNSCYCVFFCATVEILVQSANVWSNSTQFFVKTNQVLPKKANLLYRKILLKKLHQLKLNHELLIL